MNMGPGQAKQCQLRAFLTYYINDLFLNQVGALAGQQLMQHWLRFLDLENCAKPQYGNNKLVMETWKKKNL